MIPQRITICRDISAIKSDDTAASLLGRGCEPTFFSLFVGLLLLNVSCRNVPHLIVRRAPHVPPVHVLIVHYIDDRIRLNGDLIRAARIAGPLDRALEAPDDSDPNCLRIPARQLTFSCEGGAGSGLSNRGSDDAVRDRVDFSSTGLVSGSGSGR